MANLNLTVEEYELWAEPKYRTYVSAIDKALKNFESTSEWADLISALVKLNKVLTAHIDRPVIPRRIVISKRLAQCMHPALPGGVHLKALETYDIIFRCIGTSRLGRELFIYSAGLFPLLANAAMNVRPALLAIYESHFVPLKEKLRPGLPGFLNGVLPGLEEGSEYYERTNVLLEKVSSGVAMDYFYGCLWECILANASVRLPAVTFVLNHFNRRLSTEDQLHIMGTDVDIMVQALSWAVLDSSVLVQRSTLDFLLVAFPFNSGHLIRQDMERILTSAVNVVLRRDMSLNRRLYSWLLGGEGQNDVGPRGVGGSVASSDSEASSCFFETYSKDILVQALFSCLKGVSRCSSGDNIALHLRPYRLLISLLDKPEIGQAILDDILLDVFRALHYECFANSTASSLSSCQSKDRDHRSEIFKTANLLFGTLEPHYIWDYLGEYFRNTCSGLKMERKLDVAKVLRVGSGKPTVLELCLLTEFLLDLVSVETYVELQLEHLPNLLQNLSKTLMATCEKLSTLEITKTLSLCSLLLGKIQLPIGPVPTTNRGSITGKCVANERISSPEVTDHFDCDAFGTESISERVSFVNDKDVGADVVHDDEPSSRPVALLRSCIKTFQRCFVRLSDVLLFQQGHDHEKILRDFLVFRPDERSEKLERLLWNSLQSDFCDKSSFERLPSKVTRCASPVVLLHSNAASYVEGFRISCQILVDFSSLPTCIASGSRRPKGFSHTNNFEDPCVIPEWLRPLLIIACFVNQVDLQLISIGTVLELMGLSQSAVRPSPVEASRPSGGTFSVIIDPLLDTTHLEFIQRRTHFSQLVARILWNHIGEIEAGSLRRCVELLHQFHNLEPDSNTVEDVIGESMAADDEKKRVTSVQKFAILWHLSRDLPSRVSPSGKVRLLDRSLLVMLNCLNRSFGPQRSEVLSWLTHSLQRGDIGAILEPILLILLHPDTARVSVQHVSIHSHRLGRQTEKPNEASSRRTDVDESDSFSETRVYAISSVEGQVIYHIGSSLPGETSHSGSFGGTASLPTSSSRPVFALSSISSEGETNNRVVTAKYDVSVFDLPSSIERGNLNEPMCVFVNPFVSSNCNTSSSWADGLSQSTSVVDLSQAHRIDVAAIRNSSSFDDSDATSRNSLEALSSSPMKVVGTASDTKPLDVVTPILDQLLDGVFSTDEDSQSFSESRSPECEVVLKSDADVPPPPPPPFPRSSQTPQWEGLGDVSVHPLHTYMLLYSQCYDTRRVLYALKTLKGIFQANARVTVCAMATTGISSSGSSRQSLLYELLARHRKAIFGKGFLGVLPSDSTTAFRSSMYLEIIITVCLYFMRSFYPNLAHMRLSDDDLTDNWEVQLLSVELLTLLFAELATLVRDSGKGFASYIMNLLAKCKVQKAVLHCVLSGIHRIDPSPGSSSPTAVFNASDGGVASVQTFTETIIRFNEMTIREGSKDGGDGSLPCDFQETFQIAVLRLLLVLVILEDQLANHKVDVDVKIDSGSNSSDKTSRSGSSTPQQQPSLRYLAGVLIPCQPIFQTALQSALKQPYTSPLHQHWVGLVSCLLPFMRKALSSTVVSTVGRLCMNLESLSKLYVADEGRSSSDVQSICELRGSALPVDHLILQLEGLTTLCHYCLLDANNLVSTVLAGAQSSMASVTTHGLMSGPNATQIISNLINVFAPSIIRKNGEAGSDSSVRIDPLTAARHSLLAQLPRLLSSLATLWKAASDCASKGRQRASWVMGTPKVIQQHILELLSPLSHHHGVNFLAAVALAWNDKRGRQSVAPASKKVIPICSDEQLSLVELVRAIKVMPMETVIQLVRQVIKQPPASCIKKKTVVEVLVLQFFHAYIQSSPGIHLVESWASLQNLMKDTLQMNNFCPPALFFLFGILNEFVQRAPTIEDRKDQKDLQDLTQKLVESCGSVAGASLEQTTWLRRNLAVKPGPQTDIDDLDTYVEAGSRSGMISPESEKTSLSSSKTQKSSDGNGGGSNNNSSYSVQALSILSEMLAPLLDVVYQSDEKEKVLPLLAALMYNVTPYLRNHHQHNVPSFRVCSQLLASISGYQYTRRAWRRDVFDLLLDPSFFQMEVGCLRSWRIVIDNLMTHDKTTFLDLMARVSIAQSGSLSLFSSKEQEYEQRAQLLKRLAFVIFCSEVDQYQGYMPEIQERLTESLRLPQVPGVQAQVFLCFRVLLLRMLPQHVTSLWPVIITEMVQVFLQIEQELCKNSEQFSSHLRRLSTLDTSWVVSSSNGLNAHSHPAWLQLYLAVCKLLDLCLYLPADKLPQFQMYSWAFVGEPFANNVDKVATKDMSSTTPVPYSEFTPHVVRLAKLMSTKESNSKMAYKPGLPLLTTRQIKTVYDLQPFLETVANMGVARKNTKDASGDSVVRTSQDISCMERLIETDLLEPLPTSPI